MKAVPDPMAPLATSLRVYQFRVDRGYKGLTNDTKEVVVNPENGTTCRASYRVGTQYLMFARNWDPLHRNGATYEAGACSGSRDAKFAVKDIEFLESYTQGRSTTRVYGATLQWLRDFGTTSGDEWVPAPRARITLRSATTSWERLSGRDGAYSFEGLNPGKYTISAQLQGFSPSHAPETIEVSDRGCVEQMFELQSETELSGVLLDDRGRAAAKTSIGLLRRANTAQPWSGSLGLSTYTDISGHFRFEKIPTGDYLLGYEIGSGGPSFRSAVPTSYFPGTANQNEASILHLEPNQKIGNLTFKLQRPQTPRPITIEVLWADGTRPSAHLLQFFVGDELLQNLGGRAVPHIPNPPQFKGTLTFTGYQERQYKISARYWVDELGGPVPLDESLVAETNVAVIPPGAAPIKVRLVLGKPKLAND